MKSAWKSVEFREKMQNKGYYGVQGHSRSSSYRSLFIVQILHQRCHFDSKFQVEGVLPHQLFLHE